METLALTTLVELHRQIVLGVWPRGDHRNLANAVVEHNALRNRAFLDETAHRGESWCMRCGKLFPCKDLVFLFIEGAEPNSDNEGGHEGYFRIMRTCASCETRTLEEAVSMSYHSYAEEAGDGGFYVRRGGLPIHYARPYGMNTPPPALVDEVATEYGFPLRLDVVMENGREILKEGGVLLR